MNKPKQQISNAKKESLYCLLSNILRDNENMNGCILNGELCLWNIPAHLKSNKQEEDL